MFDHLKICLRPSFVVIFFFVLRNCPSDIQVKRELRATNSFTVVFVEVALNFGGAENVYSFTVVVELLLVSVVGAVIAGAVGAGGCDSGSVTGASVVSCDSKTLS